MNVLLLPGANPVSIKWLKQLASQLDLQESECTLIEYSFWTGSTSAPNLDNEVSQIPSKHFDIVLAKSLGSLILMQAGGKHLTFDRALLFGVPLKIMNETGFNKNNLKMLNNDSVLVVQQRHDKLGSSDDLINSSVKNMLVIEGFDHQYSNTEAFLPAINKWLGLSLNPN